MKKILVVTSSVSGTQGQSNQLINYFLQQAPNSVEVQQLDLVEHSLPHLTMADLVAWNTEVAERTEVQQQLAALSDDAIAAVAAADLLVIGVPMYNFGVPTQMKAWLDRIARAGVTFRYTEQGPVGLLADKPVLFIATRGGLYQGTAQDSQTTFLRQFFQFIGLNQQHFVYAEALNMGQAEPATATAKAELLALASRWLR
jgi:FMN-dependent NADH-azoreductase